MAIRDAVFHSYVDGYVAAIRSYEYSDLAAMQPRPYATLYHGGAGTAYVLARVGQMRLARRWLAAAQADRRASGFTWDSHAAKPSSYLFGRAGLYWVDALIGDRAATARYLRLARRATEIEFMDGAAGHLTAARLLLARRADDRVRSLAETLAEKLNRRLRARSLRPWQAEDAAGGFAHHWIGIIHALLEWNREISAPTAPWLLDSIQRLAAQWSPRTVRPKAMVGSWCQGAAGATLLWCSAYTTTNAPVFLRCAREAGQVALSADHPSVDLCCGWAGAAFALLELERIDRKSGWRTRAREIGARVINAPSLYWPNGLFRGHPGLVCLALDLVAEPPVGFPAILG